MLSDINRRVNHLKVQWQIFTSIDKRPRNGCLNSGKFAAWECCEFHGEINKKHQQMKIEAQEITAILFPSSQQTEDCLNIFWIDRKLVSCLSPGWWERVERKIQLPL